MLFTQKLPRKGKRINVQHLRSPTCPAYALTCSSPRVGLAFDFPKHQIPKSLSTWNMFIPPQVTSIYLVYDIMILLGCVVWMWAKVGVGATILETLRIRCPETSSGTPNLGFGMVWKMSFPWDGGSTCMFTSLLPNTLTSFQSFRFWFRCSFDQELAIPSWAGWVPRWCSCQTNTLQQKF